MDLVFDVYTLIAVSDCDFIFYFCLIDCLLFVITVFGSRHDSLPG